MSELDELNEQMGNNSDADIASLLENEANETERLEREDAIKAEEKETVEKVDEAMGIAVTSVELLAKAVNKKWDYLDIDSQTKLEISKKAAAVLAKYDCKLPPWLAAYKEEIELGLCLGTVIAGCYVTVQKHKKLEAEAAEGGENGDKLQQ